MRQFRFETFRRESIPTDIRMTLALLHDHQARQPVLCCENPFLLRKLHENAKIRSAYASNRIEGIVTAERRLDKILKGEAELESGAEKEILGYYRCLDLVFRDMEISSFAPEFACELHRELFRSCPGRQCGNFRDKEMIHIIQNLCTSYNLAAARNVAPMLVLDLLFVRDFLDIRPFFSGNARISRILILRSLSRRGFEVGKYVSIESMIEKTKGSYFKALEDGTKRRDGSCGESWEFIRYMLGILMAACREFEVRVC